MVTFYGLIKRRGRYTIDPRQGRVENHSLVTHKQNQWLKRFLSDSIVIPWHPEASLRQVTRGTALGLQIGKCGLSLVFCIGEIGL